MTSKLKLGPLPSSEVVKVTVALPLELHRALERYAELHAQASDSNADLSRLIPHMLATFIRGDRAFRRAVAREGGRRSTDANPRPA